MGSLTFTLSWGNWYATNGTSGGVIHFPVVPNEGIELSSETSNQTYEGLNGQLLLLGRHSLKQWAIQSFFPAKEKQYKFLNVDGGVIKRVPVDEEKMTRAGANHAYGARHYTTKVLKDGIDIINQLEEIRSQMIPMRAIYTMDGRQVFNLPCTIQSLQWGREQSGDIKYSISFIEYVFPEYSEAELGQQTDPADATETENKECDPSVFQTSSEASSSGSSTYSRQGPCEYTETDVLYLCRHIVCECCYPYSTMYIDDSTHKVYHSSATGRRAITRDTVVSSYLWVLLYRCDKTQKGKTPDTLSQALESWLDDKQFGYRATCSSNAAMGYNYYNDNGLPSRYADVGGSWGTFNLEEVVRHTLDQWSDYKNGYEVTSTVPADYFNYWGSIGDPGGTYYGDYDCGMAYIFNETLWTSGTIANKAIQWIKDGKAWDWHIAY